MSALLWQGCKGKKKPQPAAAPVPQEQTKAAPKKPTVKPIALPKVAPPAIAEGRRVVHLVYTTNNDGEVDPCG